MSDVEDDLRNLLNEPCPPLDEMMPADEPVPVAAPKKRKAGACSSKPSKKLVPATVSKPPDGSSDSLDASQLELPPFAPSGARVASPFASSDARRTRSEDVLPLSEATNTPTILQLADAVSTLQSTVMSLLPPASRERSLDEVDDAFDVDTLLKTDSVGEDDQLGDFSHLMEEKDEPIGEPISCKAAEIINKLIRSNLKESTLKDKVESYSRPENCESLTHTRVNPEVWSVLKSATRSLDSKLQKVQQLSLN